MEKAREKIATFYEKNGNGIGYKAIARVLKNAESKIAEFDNAINSSARNVYLGHYVTMGDLKTEQEEWKRIEKEEFENYAMEALEEVLKRAKGYVEIEKLEAEYHAQKQVARFEKDYNLSGLKRKMMKFFLADYNNDDGLKHTIFNDLLDSKNYQGELLDDLKYYLRD